MTLKIAPEDAKRLAERYTLDRIREVLRLALARRRRSLKGWVMTILERGDLVGDLVDYKASWNSAQQERHTYKDGKLVPGTGQLVKASEILSRTRICRR